MFMSLIKSKCYSFTKKFDNKSFDNANVFDCYFLSIFAALKVQSGNESHNIKPKFNDKKLSLSLRTRVPTHYLGCKNILVAEKWSRLNSNSSVFVKSPTSTKKLPTENKTADCYRVKSIKSQILNCPKILARNITFFQNFNF